jgi:arginyl-tRNA synthetase
LLRDILQQFVESAVDSLIASGQLPEVARVPVEITDTKNPDHGDYACNFALVATKKAGLPPRQIGELLAGRLMEEHAGHLHGVEIAGPGFLNLRLRTEFVAAYVGKIIELGTRLPHALKSASSDRPPKRINVEFVSVNPNGPITVGSGRGAAFGDALVRVFAAAGYEVDPEYYINDGVNSQQMRLFAESVKSYALEEPFPENGYKGEYVKAVAIDVAREFSAEDLGAKPLGWWQARSQDLMLARQHDDLATFGVNFKVWFSEQSMHESGLVAASLEKLKANGSADADCYRAEVVREGKEERLERKPEKCGPLWLRATQFGDDKDRVLLRSDGRPAYISGDVAYMESKLGQRGYDKAYIILGPDHHGYIPRMNAVCKALGYPPERLEIIIFQIVRFLKDGKPAPMRKRDGNIYELRDLIDEIGANAAPNADQLEQRRVGRDVSRFFYLMRSHDTHMDFDIDLATKQSDENPVFYVQYAHARICSVLAKAAEAGILTGETVDASVWLTHPREMALIKKILDLPLEVARCAKDYGVHRLTTYAVELARTYHHFYDACRVIQPEEPELSRARVALCRAAAIGLKATFDLLGISAPERMDREVPIPLVESNPS